MGATENIDSTSAQPRARTEDVALGFWPAQLLVSGGLPSLTYARALPDQTHNLGCQKHDSLYRNPKPATSVAIHYVKKPTGMAYLHGVMANGAPHLGKACTRAAGVG